MKRCTCRNSAWAQLRLLGGERSFSRAPGPSRVTARMARRALVTWLFLFAVGVGRALRADDTAPTRRESFKIAKAGNPIFLPVRIGSRQYHFLMDTGSAITSFDTSLMGHLGGATSKEMIYTPYEDDPREVQRFRAPALSLGKATLRGAAEVICVDYRARGLTIDGEAPDGWLGIDALRDLIVQIDFDKGELSRLPSVPADSGSPVPLVWFRGVPCVRVSLDSGDVQFSTTARFTVDTGGLSVQSGTIYGPVFRALLHYKLASEAGRSREVTIANTTEARTARVADFRLGDFSHRRLVFTEASCNSLSLEYLSRYVVTFDFPHMRIFLKPGARYSDPDRAHATHLHLRG
ncbi:MAG TPA: retropepsin-like aspartic protease, partial [Pirellulales bacterium]|nr:retropepsin-like aspartic protease [Pirellulales bacterium]